MGDHNKNYDKLLKEKMPYLNAPTGTWIKQNGELIEICDMTVEYLNNAISFIKKQKKLYLQDCADEIKDKLFPLAQRKFNDLQGELKARIKSQIKFYKKNKI